MTTLLDLIEEHMTDEDSTNEIIVAYCKVVAAAEELLEDVEKVLVKMNFDEKPKAFVDLKQALLDLDRLRLRGNS